MKLLPEYALLHEAFEAERPWLAYLRDVILNDGIVRDLRVGGWFAAFRERMGRLSPMAREMVEALAKKRRLPFPAMDNEIPITDSDWCREALATHRVRELEAIIAGSETARKFSESDLIVPVDALDEANLHDLHTDSVRPRFRMSEYVEHLELVLTAAGRLCFIDPYIDPAHREYGDFLELLIRAGTRTPKPHLEIHRKCSYRLPGEAEKIHKDENVWRSVFASWDESLVQRGVSARVLIWDDFKLRYLISDLIGLHLGKGFKTNKHPTDRDQWSRLSRKDREDIDREFDKDGNSPSHKLWCAFNIGAASTD